jgi:hypothetical protein
LEFKEELDEVVKQEVGFGGRGGVYSTKKVREC